jgi:hypothetical protein
VGIGTRTWGTVVVGNGAASLAVPYPTSPSAGDLLVIHCYCRANTAGGFTLPGGWTAHKAYTQTANGGYAVYFKEAAGGESGTVTLTASTAGDTQIARMYKAPGAGTVAADFVAGAAETESADPQVNAGVGSPGVDGAMVVFLGATQDCITNNETDGLGSVSGGTNVGAWTTVSNGSTGGLDAGMGSSTAIQSTAAATGNITGDWQASQATYAGISYTYAVKPRVASGTLAVTLTAVALAATGIAEAQGALARTLDAVALAATGTAADAGASGALARTLDAVALAAAGVAEAQGALAVTLASVALAASGQAEARAALDAALAAVAVAAAGQAEARGALAATLAAIAISASGQAEARGALAATLASVALAGTGVAAEGPVGVLDLTLAPVALAATGQAEARGVLDVTLAAVALSAAAQAEAQGALALALAAVALAATASSLIVDDSPAARLVELSVAVWQGELSAAARLLELSAAARLFG